MSRFKPGDIVVCTHPVPQKQSYRGNVYVGAQGRVLSVSTQDYMRIEWFEPAHWGRDAAWDMQYFELVSIFDPSQVKEALFVYERLRATDP